MNALLDTNAVLYHLKGLTVERTLSADRVFVSVITEIELLGHKHLDVSQESAIRDFLGQVEVLPLDEAIKRKTIELRRSTSLRIPDAIIAASAICMTADLISNDAGMSGVPGVRCSHLRLKGA